MANAPLAGDAVAVKGTSRNAYTVNGDVALTGAFKLTVSAGINAKAADTEANLAEATAVKVADGQYVAKDAYVGAAAAKEVAGVVVVGLEEGLMTADTAYTSAAITADLRLALASSVTFTQVTVKYGESADKLFDLIAAKGEASTKYIAEGTILVISNGNDPRKPVVAGTDSYTVVDDTKQGEITIKVGNGTITVTGNEAAGGGVVTEPFTVQVGSNSNDTEELTAATTISELTNVSSLPASGTFFEITVDDGDAAEAVTGGNSFTVDSKLYVDNTAQVKAACKIAADGRGYYKVTGLGADGTGVDVAEAGQNYAVPTESVMGDTSAKGTGLLYTVDQTTKYADYGSGNITASGDITIEGGYIKVTASVDGSLSGYSLTAEGTTTYLKAKNETQTVTVIVADSNDTIKSNPTNVKYDSTKLSKTNETVTSATDGSNTITVTIEISEDLSAINEAIDITISAIAA